MSKLLRIYILLALFSTASFLAFADSPDSALDDKPSVDTAANTGVQVPAVPADTTAPDAHASYIYDLKKLIEKSRQNIKQVNEKRNGEGESGRRARGQKGEGARGRWRCRASCP